MREGSKVVGRWGVKGVEVTEYKMAKAEYLLKYHPEAQKLVWMSPNEFLELIPPYAGTPWNRENIENLKEKMLRGEELDPLFIDVYAESKRRCQVINHEGRHRAKAAEELGIKSVPVLIYHRDQRHNFVSIDSVRACDVHELKKFSE